VTFIERAGYASHSDAGFRVCTVGGQFHERFRKNQARGSSWHNEDVGRTLLASDQVIFAEVTCACVDSSRPLLFNLI
jgi:hypothetical protein